MPLVGLCVYVYWHLSWQLLCHVTCALNTHNMSRKWFSPTWLLVASSRGFVSASSSCTIVAVQCHVKTGLNWSPCPRVFSPGGLRLVQSTVNPVKLETGLRPNNAGSPYTLLLTLLLRIEAIGFPTFWLLLYGSMVGLCRLYASADTARRSSRQMTKTVRNSKHTNQ